MPNLGTIDNVLKRNVGDRVYYIGTLSSDMAKDVTFAPVVEDSDTYLTQILDRGYQRPGRKARMNQFKKYLKEFTNRLIPPVILSARGKWIFKPESSGVIGQIQIDDRAAIVDGQHRVGGIVSHFQDTNEPIQFDFICFDNLSYDEEVNEFLTINGKQVGVSKALQAYLGGDPNKDLAWELNEHDDSPFYKRISRTTMGPDHLFALHSVTKNVARTFSHGSLSELDHATKKEILLRYWNCIKMVNQTAWADAAKEKKKDHTHKLLELTGNIAWSIVAPEILLKGYRPNDESFDWEEIENVISFVSQDMDWEKQGEFYGMTGEVGGRRIANFLQNALGYYNTEE